MLDCLPKGNTSNAMHFKLRKAEIAATKKHVHNNGHTNTNTKSKKKHTITIIHLATKHNRLWRFVNVFSAHRNGKKNGARERETVKAEIFMSVCCFKHLFFPHSSAHITCSTSDAVYSKRTNERDRAHYEPTQLCLFNSFIIIVVIIFVRFFVIYFVRECVSRQLVCFIHVKSDTIPFRHVRDVTDSLAIVTRSFHFFFYFVFNLKYCGKHTPEIVSHFLYGEV